MGWAVGYDHNWRRDIGYGVPAVCDHPGCNEEINRGLAYVCGGEPYGGEDGCGLHFCGKHLRLGVEGKERQVCERCAKGQEPFAPKPDTAEWMRWKLTDPSWQQWRDENPAEVADMQKRIEAEVMEVGDSEWRRRAAKVLRDTRRLMGRDFAKLIAGHIHRVLDARTGESIG